jgi:hypothetical protein
MTHMPKRALPLCMVLLVLGGLYTCPVAALSPDTPFITIDPVGDHAIGEIITISGTTNYPVNATFWISLGPKVFTNYPPNYFDGQTQVTSGEGSNYWQITVNTSAFVIDEYSVRVEPVNSTPLFSSATFNMTGKNVGVQETPATPVIVIDSPGSHTTAEEFFINGTTNLAVSNGSLLLQIGTAEFNPGGFGSSFYESNVSIQQGEHGVNPWSAEVLPSQWKVYTKPPDYYPTPTSSPPMAGRYQVVVSSKNPYGPDVLATTYLFIASPDTANTSGSFLVEETPGPVIKRLELSKTHSWYLTLLSLFSMASVLQPGAIQTPSQVTENVPLLTVLPLQEYAPGEQVLINGTTSLPAGELLDIAFIKEPFHTTKCDPGTFCGSGTYSTIVSAGRGSNVWSYRLNTTGFPEGSYDIWIVSRNQSNTSVHTTLSLSKRVARFNTSSLAIAFENETVQSLLSGGYSVQSIEPSTVGINQITFNVTCVMFDTPQDSVGVNVDVKNNSVVNIWTLPKREPMPESYPEPLLSAVTRASSTKSHPFPLVNYSEIAYIGQQDPSDPMDENRKNVVAQAAIADDRVRTLLVDGGMIEGVLFQCHPTPKDSGGSACALALRVLYEGSNWDFLVDEKSREVISVQREVLPGRI